MKLIKGRFATYCALGLLLFSFVTMIVSIAVYGGKREAPADVRAQIIGQYSLDGGEWYDTIPRDMINDRFHTAVIKGKLSVNGIDDQELVIFADNIWFEVLTESSIVNNGPHKDENGAPLSPGSSVATIPVYPEDGAQEINCTITLTFPYTMFSNRDLSDYFNLYLIEPEGVYNLVMQKTMLPVLFCLLICFFGLFAFPIAGTVLGGINIRYLAFSILCFFTGLHLLGQTLYAYLPLWIGDPKLCMSICEMTSHLLGLCVLIFIKVLLKESTHKIIGNIALYTFSVLIILLMIFNVTGVRDLYASNPFAQFFFAICAITLTGCLIREVKDNNDAKLAVFTLIPLAVTLLFDTANQYLGFSRIMLFEVGVAIALFYQIINLLIDLRRQYKETIRYQQMQRELYESRVAIMVSQIQPHFLYNSLTSIAMMCSINPETAQEATITFADYLRGNMDSLKEKNPVPFERELEHLKKYLYIEKLRFGDDLNIAYDIQTTDFVLPQLSIQPLVENAVKHGVGMKREGGTVTIATRETDTAYEVIVSDDGVGFDTQAVKDDGRSHIGMDNVRRRLKEMCGGSVEITSTIGEGTVAKVTLPKEGQQNENTMR